MIRQGHVVPAAFVLRPSINEEYLSVLRISMPTFNQDVKSIIYGRKRSFYGYAILKVDEIHAIQLTAGSDTIRCRVLVVDNNRFRSHAGIFVIINDQPVTGAMSFESLPNGVTQKYLLLALRFRLTEMAERGLIAF